VCHVWPPCLGPPLLSRGFSRALRRSLRRLARPRWHALGQAAAGASVGFVADGGAPGPCPSLRRPRLTRLRHHNNCPGDLAPFRYSEPTYRTAAVRLAYVIAQSVARLLAKNRSAAGCRPVTGYTISLVAVAAAVLLYSRVEVLHNTHTTSHNTRSPSGLASVNLGGRPAARCQCSHSTARSAPRAVRRLLCLCGLPGNAAPCLNAAATVGWVPQLGSVPGCSAPCSTAGSPGRSCPARAALMGSPLLGHYYARC